MSEDQNNHETGGGSGRSGQGGFVRPGGTVNGTVVGPPSGGGNDGGGRAPASRRPGSAVARRPAVRRTVVPVPVQRVVVRVVVTTQRVVTHERTRNAARWAARNLVLYLLTGAGSVVRRWWESRTNARYERLMRAAEAAGDYERLTDWESRGEQARERRHRRRMDWVTAPVDVARAVAVTVLVVALFLLGLGGVLAIGYQDFGWLLAPLRTAVDVIAWVVWLVSVVWLPALWVAPFVVAAGLWEVGRRHGAVPGWAASTAAQEAPTVILTPGGVATALAHLGIPAMNRAVKQGWQVEFSTPPVRVNNRGYQTTFSLPMGVTPDMIADRRDVLARNLVRAPLEVWPSAAERAGYVDLWVADQGSTERAAPSYPLLHTGTADVFAGIPCGVSQRGDVIMIVLPGGNVSFGGVMGQGKSNAARVVMVGAALDPLAELWVFVFANNGDFDAYRPRLSRYHRGTDDATITAALDGLRALYEEVGRREARLAELGAKKVTRALAEKYPDLRPVVALFSECHELFGHDQHGKEAADLAVQTLRRARKTAISLAFDTQSARADAIPPKIVELVSVNACFAVKSWRSNDGFLGDGSFQAGIRATELRMGKDIGTSLLTGATAELFEILKWFYIEVDDDTGFDAAADIIARAMDNLHPDIGTLITGGTGESSAEAPAEPPRDLLDDIGTVLGVATWSTEKVPAADIPARLRSLAPDWAPYRTINGLHIRRYLESSHGVKVATTGHKYPVDPAAVRDAITRRNAHTPRPPT